MNKNTFTLIASLLITLSASAEDMELKFEICDMGMKPHADAWEQVYNSLIENSNNAIVMEKPEKSVVINDMSSYNATMMKDESHNWVATPEAVEKYGYYTPLREFEWSTVPLIAFGFAAKANKKNFRAARNNFIPAYENRFDDNLNQVEGQKVKFQFNYNYGGEDLALDNFALKVLDEQSAEAIHIFEGDSITFISTSLGDPDSLQWTLDGATPPASTLKTVTATYAHSGSYDVTLTVKRGTESNTITRKAYVVVSQQAPTAIIGLPEEGYESPFVGVFVPVNVPVTFRDLSTGNPTEWKWVFQNTDITSSTEQNPTVTYLDKGRFSVGLTAKNAAGQSNDVLTYAVQAGGAQYVWNISTEENTNLSKIALGWYGNYAGSNWLGMRRFAELYKAPLADATIDSVAVYFASNATVSPDSTIVLTVNAVDDKGNPGQILGTTSIKASQIKYSDDDYLATVFKLAQPVKLSKGQKFFVVVGPFPNATDEASYKTDDIAIFCLRRPVGGKCTTWHELEDQDENGRSLGTYSWLPNTDDPVSMAIAPVVTYDALSTAVTTVEQSNPSNSKIVAIYTLSGMQVDSMEPGHIYIVKRADGTASKVKIVK